MDRQFIIRQAEAAREQLEDLENRMADPAIVTDQKQMSELGREHRRLRTLLQHAHELEKLEEQLRSAREMLDEDDDELAEMARAEVEELEGLVNRVETALRLALSPKEEEDSRDAILEIRAGTGGEEAGLFAADLYRMYQRFIERRGWKSEPISSSPSEMGGFKEVIFAVRGEDAYGILKFESGVHRVQRVPVTESQGRVHTSAASVAVLPEAEEVDVEINPKDLRIDVYRSTGHGGQSVNTTDSAVRITHLPTGLVVTCQDEKSQLKNKIKAMQVLRARLYQRALEAEETKRSASRKSLVGSGDRSAKIRTYNYPQKRVTDHRINLTLYRLDEILDGSLDEIIDALRLADTERRLEDRLP